MHPMIALWAHPRSLSTAFERSFSERNDFTVFHEPFSYLYYVHEARADIPHKHPSPDHPRTYEAISGMLEAARREGPVFHKDMCYHCIDHVMRDPAFLKARINTFLIRDPARTILSHATIHPGVARENLGYEPMLRMFETAADLTGTAPVVINAADLQDNPRGTIRALCAAVGIDYIERALTWNPGERTEWATWKEWHKDAADSTGISRAPEQYAVSFEDEPRLVELLDYALPFYQALDRYRLSPIHTTIETEIAQ